MANNTGRYILVQKVRDSVDVGDLTDANIEDLIDEHMQYIDVKTGNWFNERDITLTIEGSNTSLLQVGIPILSIEHIKLNGETTILSSSSYIVFKGNSFPDDRKNPRIKLYSGTTPTIFQGGTNSVFLRGTLTEIKGKFGYLESDGTTPAMIQKAVLLLVINDIKTPVTNQVQTGFNGVHQLIKREKTDIHEREFFENKRIGASGSSSGITKVDEAIKLYRAPVAIRGSFPDVPVNTLIGYHYPVGYNYDA